MMISLDIRDDLGGLYGDWRQLWQDSGANPFLHPAWNLAFVEATERCGESFAPLVLRAVCDGDLVGLLPMRRDSDGVLRYLSSPRADYEDVLVRADACGEAVLVALAEWLGTERFEFDHLPESSAFAKVLGNCGLRTVPSTPCPGIRLDETNMCDVGRRKSVRRHEKRLARYGTVILREAELEERDSILSCLMDQHVARWLASGSESLFLEERWREFYRCLVASPDFSEFGRLHVLEAGGHRVACHLGLSAAGEFIWYKPSYDLNRAADGPGEVMLRHLVEAAWSEGASYFDFSRGGEDFKLRFANEQRRTLTCRRRLPIFPSFRRRILAALKRLRVVAGGLRYRCGGLLPRPGAELHFEVAVPDSPVALPAGYEWSFGEVDLTAFGASRSHAPSYVTPARMARAVERRKQGQRLLVVRRVGDDVPVHYSWLRSDGRAARGDLGEVPMPEGHTAAVIFDCWTSPEERGRGLYAAAIRILAQLAHDEGEIPWIYCDKRNIASRLGILKAGTVNVHLVPAARR